MIEDIKTQQQAYIIARQYNFVPDIGAKCERVVPETPLRSLFFANTSNSVKCLVQYDLDARTITSVTSPDVRGVYRFVDFHNNKNYYRRTDEAWFIWWDGVDTWNLSTELGVQGDDFWTRTDPEIDGDYDPQGTAEGTVAVDPPIF